MEERDNTWLKKDLAGLAYVICCKCVCLSLPFGIQVARNSPQLVADSPSWPLN